MFAIIGILVVFGAVIGGYLLEKGHLAVLMQPAELVIIGGAAIGTVLIGNPPHILKQMLTGLIGAFKGSRFSTALYLDSLKMLYDLFNRARRDGLGAVESDIEEPDKSAIFKNYTKVIADHHVRDFVCDTLRMAAAGAVEPFDLDQMMELDMEVHHHEAALQPRPLSTRWPMRCPGSASWPPCWAS